MKSRGKCFNSRSNRQNYIYTSHDMEDEPFTGPSQDNISERITFIVPSSSDFERITSFKNFTALWNDSYNISGGNHLNHSLYDGSKLSANDGSEGGSNKLFGMFVKLINRYVGDFHLIVNYLWIGAVVILVVLSLIFLLFTVYFYRKFVKWKKCNKNIQSQIPNNLPGPYRQDVFNRSESPPCYTIATGLPTYNEALFLHAANQYEYQLSWLWWSSWWKRTQENYHQHQQPSNSVLPERGPVGSDNACYMNPKLLFLGRNNKVPTKCVNSDQQHHQLTPSFSSSQNVSPENNFLNVVVLP